MLRYFDQRMVEGAELVHICSQMPSKQVGEGGGGGFGQSPESKTEVLLWGEESIPGTESGIE